MIVMNADTGKVAAALRTGAGTGATYSTRTHRQVTSAPPGLGPSERSIIAMPEGSR